MDKLVEEILRKGDERAQEIVRQGEEERQQQTDLADEEISLNREKGEKRLEMQIAQMEQHELSSAELESRKMLLAAQREVLEDLRERILVELSHYSQEKRNAIYSRLFAKAKSILGECYVYSGRNDADTLSPPAGITKAGMHISRSYGIHTDMILSQFQGHNLGRHHKAGFADSIYTEIRLRLVGLRRGNINNTASTNFLHYPGYGLAEEQNPLQIEVNDGIPKTLFNL